MTDWDCAICGSDTQLEYYMVHDEIWKQFGVDPLLCLGCLESRMGRELDSSDFTDCLLNEVDMGWDKSPRLVDRLERIG